ncbi:MAG: HD-GYP domain-containing protein, partial [Oscillospiraceae bacterium]|nr:HD-GYP domain-containing protein [Oscillospiraceae bacterium]
MRYISIDKLTEGMTAGKPLYGSSGHLLVQSGTILTGAVITKLKKIGYTGLYINDQVSVKIEPKEVV